METKPLKLYNVIFPFWLILFWPSPPVILLTLLGNLAIDCLVVFLALLALKHPARGSVLKRCWWKVWLFGFLSDVIGAVWLTLGLFGSWALDANGTAGWVSGLRHGHDGQPLPASPGPGVDGRRGGHRRDVHLFP